MNKRFRTIILAVLPIALGASISSAGGTAAAATLPGCNNPADSAFNQYCDSIPSPTGPQRPQAGARSLGATLPSRAARQIAGTEKQQISGRPRQRVSGAKERRRRARRALLTLPAPGPRHALSTSRATVTSPWSLSLWMILILVAVAAALLAVALARWRKHRPGTPE